MKPGVGQFQVGLLTSPLMRAHCGWSGKIRWHLNARLTLRLALLNAAGVRLTIVDAYGAPGDTLLTATVIRNIHRRFPRLRLNCVTTNPELMERDPNLHSINEPETFFSVWSWYPELAARRDGTTNVLRETFDRMGWGAANYDYKAHVYLSSDEKAHGRELLGAPTRPILTFHTRSKEEVKNWPMESWHAVLALFRDLFHLVHIGDSSEPVIEGVQRFAGRLSLRESMSVLSHAHVHMGADSFLMHAANGLDVPSVIIFGGSRTPANLGYTGNVNLFASMPCGPCWLQPSRGEQCLHGIACMGKIHVEEVVTAVRRLAAQEPRAPK